MVMASLLLASPSPLSIQSQTSFSSNSHLSFSQSQTLFSPLFTSFPSLSLSTSATSTTSSPSVYCGRGDRKTAKGKRFNHSFGNARPRNKNKGRGAPRIYAPPDSTKKDKLEDKELVKIELDESLFSDLACGSSAAEAWCCPSEDRPILFSLDQMVFTSTTPCCRSKGSKSIRFASPKNVNGYSLARC